MGPNDSGTQLFINADEIAVWQYRSHNLPTQKQVGS